MSHWQWHSSWLFNQRVYQTPVWRHISISAVNYLRMHQERKNTYLFPRRKVSQCFEGIRLYNSQWCLADIAMIFAVYWYHCRRSCCTEAFKIWDLKSLYFSNFFLLVLVICQKLVNLCQRAGQPRVVIRMLRQAAVSLAPETTVLTPIHALFLQVFDIENWGFPLSPF